MVQQCVQVASTGDISADENGTLILHTEQCRTPSMQRDADILSNSFSFLLVSQKKQKEEEEQHCSPRVSAAQQSEEIYKTCTAEPISYCSKPGTERKSERERERH